MTPGPVRTCVGCRRRSAPHELLRIAVTRDGQVLVGQGPGRGAWCCSVECFDRALARRALGRALRHDLTNDDIARVRARLGGWATGLPEPPTTTNRI